MHITDGSFYSARKKCYPTITLVGTNMIKSKPPKIIMRLPSIITHFSFIFHIIKRLFFHTFWWFPMRKKIPDFFSQWHSGRSCLILSKNYETYLPSKSLEFALIASKYFYARSLFWGIYPFFLVRYRKKISWSKINSSFCCLSFPT